MKIKSLELWETTALSIRSNFSQIQDGGKNGTDIFLNFIPKFWCTSRV